MADPFKLHASGGAMRLFCHSVQQILPCRVHCLAGLSFELEVNSAETGWEVAGRIAARVGHPAEVLMLTSVVVILDHQQPLLHQVQHEELTYVVRKLGAGRAARSLECLLAGKTLSDADVVASTN